MLSVLCIEAIVYLLSAHIHTHTQHTHKTLFKFSSLMFCLLKTCLTYALKYKDQRNDGSGNLEIQRVYTCVGVSVCMCTNAEVLCLSKDVQPI